nr:Guanine nucleotide-binding protein subunit beta-2 [Ipomoea batatas]
MSVAELKERHMAATQTVNSLRERLKEKRLLLLDTDVSDRIRVDFMAVATYARSQATVCLGHDLWLLSNWPGQSVACGGLDSVCSIFNLNPPPDSDGNSTVSRTLSGHKGYVSSCQYVPNEDAHLITTSGDKTCG